MSPRTALQAVLLRALIIAGTVLLMGGCATSGQVKASLYRAGHIDSNGVMFPTRLERLTLPTQTVQDMVRYRPTDHARTQAYLTCLADTTGRDHFDICMAQKGYER